MNTGLGRCGATLAALQRLGDLSLSPRLVAPWGPLLAVNGEWGPMNVMITGKIALNQESGPFEVLTRGFWETKVAWVGATYYGR
jgi:hypothetical protein